jgi:hypothetical protein
MENEFFTVSEIAKELEITTTATNARLNRKGRRPCKFIGSAGLYTKADLEAIRDGGKRGRPKAKTSKPAPKTKKKVATKKK